MIYHTLSVVLKQTHTSMFRGTVRFAQAMPQGYALNSGLTQAQVDGCRARLKSTQMCHVAAVNQEIGPLALDQVTAPVEAVWLSKDIQLRCVSVICVVSVATLPQPARKGTSAAT
jgi:hypothetical protein